MGRIFVGENELVVNNDFEDTRAKKAAVFLADLFQPGTIGSLEPRSGQQVRVELAPDVSQEAIHAVCQAAGIVVEQRPAS